MMHRNLFAYRRLSLPQITGLLLTLAWIGIFTTLAFNFHAALRSNRSDLGQIDQAVWNSSQGRFLENSDAGFHRHPPHRPRRTDPRPHQPNLLALERCTGVVAVAGGCGCSRGMVYLENQWGDAGAATRLGLNPHLPISPSPHPPYLPFAFTIAYLLAPQLQHAVLTEFHAAPLAVPLILWALWAVETRRTRQFVIAALLVACVKEEMAIAAAGLGVWALYRNTKYEIRNTKEQSLRPPHSAFRIPPSALRTITLSPCHPISLSPCLPWLWFAIATFVIVPANAPLVYDQAKSVYLERFGVLGNTPFSIVRTLLSDPATVWSVLSEPARLNYLWGLLAPFGFLSLLAPELLIVALPLLIANVFSTYPGQYYNEFHYSAPLVPYVAVSAVIGARRLWGWVGRWGGGERGERGKGEREIRMRLHSLRTTHH